MLIPNYSLQKLKTINNATLKETTTTFRAFGCDIPTTTNNPLEANTPHELNNLFDIQLKLVKDELSIQKSYGIVTKQGIEDTIKQYNTLYIYEGFAYNKAALLLDSNKRFNLSNTQVTPPILEQPNEPNTIYQPQYNKTVGISVQSLRNITGFSYYPIPAWSETNTPVYIRWQQDMIEDTSDILVIDGSRQMGKSFGMAELLIEESFIPGADILVAAFLQKTTNVILRYIEKLTYGFDEGTFEVRSKDGFIQNTVTGVRIHFRTLADDAKNVLGLTLRLVIIDEAQEVTKEIFDDALIPTLATTGGRMVLIGTAIEDTSSYMYHLIQEYHMGVDYNNPGQKTIRYIKVSILENPMVHPKERRNILAKQDKPSTQRQFFNRWGKQSDSQFSPTTISINTIEINKAGHLLIAYDPARAKDRSAYVMAYCFANKVIILQSGEVDSINKVDWNLQAKFHLQKLKQMESEFQSISTAMDVTGVGDGVLPIFRASGLNINHTVRYTTGSSETETVADHFNVSKHILINNTLDMIESKSLLIVQESNQNLIEEFSYCGLKEGRFGLLALDTKFFDDLINATMIAVYFARKKRYMFRTTITKTHNAFAEEMRLRGIKKNTSNKSDTYF